MFDFDPAAVRSAADSSPAFRLNARFWTADVLFRMGDEAYRLEMRDGAIRSFGRDAGTGSADIVVSGPAASWERLLQAIPPARYHDVMFDDGASGFRVEGDLVGAVAPYYHAVQEFIDVMRRVRSGAPPVTAIAEMDRDFDVAVGRYTYVRIEGVQYRIYYEEAGDGPIPMLLQHTAGADGRQWRHVLEDPDYRKLYRMIAYDLPYHGKSVPPATRRWWEQDYILTRSFLMETVLAVSRRLGLESPVFMGCSIGGLLAPDLALYHPDAFRAVIGINGGLAIDLSQGKPGFETAWSNPRVGGQWKAAGMRANTAPTSPDAYRRETAWIYSQGAPPVMEGDVHYYMHGHDLTAEQAAQIDTSRVAVYLLTGEYDALATDEGTALLARAIPGSHFRILPGLGHFGPSENPDGFKTILLPVLEEISRLKARPATGK